MSNSMGGGGEVQQSVKLTIWLFKSNFNALEDKMSCFKIKCHVGRGGAMGVKSPQNCIKYYFIVFESIISIFFLFSFSFLAVSV